MTLAWRMYVCMCVCVCMGWQAGWERMCLVGGELLEGEGWARVRKKKHQGPQPQEFPVDWERGTKQKADSSQQCSHKGVSGSSAASQRGPLSSDYRSAQGS